MAEINGPWTVFIDVKICMIHASFLAQFTAHLSDWRSTQESANIIVTGYQSFTSPALTHLKLTKIARFKINVLGASIGTLACD